MGNTLKPDMTYDEVVFTRDESEWLLARNDYYNKLGGKGISVKTISDAVYGVSFLLSTNERKVLIVLNDHVATGYKGKRYYKTE